MDVRRLYLRNNRNEVFDFMDTSHFLVSPGGLGAALSLPTVRLGNSELVTGKEYNLQTFTGEIYFMGTREEVYTNYRSFVRFLNTDYLRLCYQPVGAEHPYYCRAEVTQITKTEVGNRDSILHVPVQIKCLQFWRKTPQTAITVTPNEAVGKSYPLVRPYHYAEASFKKIDCVNNGDVETPLNIIIQGSPIIDPMYSLYDENYALYGRGRILGAYKYVEVDADDLTESIILKTTNSTLSNTYNMQDLSVGSPNEVYVTFLKLKPGTSYINVNLPDDFDGTVTLKYWEMFISV